MKATFSGLPKPRAATVVPDPDLSKLDAIACQAPSRSMPESEATTPAAAPVATPEVTPDVAAAPAPEVAPVTDPVAAKPEKADNRRYGPNGEALHQFTVRLSDADWLKLRMYCIQNRVTATDVIIETVRKLP